MRVRLKAIGAVQQVSPSLTDFPREAPFAVIADYLRDKLKLGNTQRIWCYIGNAFIPGMDDSLDTIIGFTGISSKNTAKDEELVVTYSLVEAFG